MYIFNLRTGTGQQDMNYGAAAIVAICIIVLVMGTLKKKAQIVFGFLARMAIGGIGIYFCNLFLAKQHISVSVGLNPASLLTVGTLGISGFALLYGILIYQNL